MEKEKNQRAYSQLDEMSERQQELGVSLHASEYSLQLLAKLSRQINPEMLLRLLADLGVQERFINSEAVEDLGLLENPDHDEFFLLAESYVPSVISTDVDFNVRADEIMRYLEESQTSHDVPKELFISVKAGTVIAKRKSAETLEILENPVNVFGQAVKGNTRIVKFKTGKGLKEDGKGYIIAEIAGRLTLSGGTLNIEETFSIKSLEDWFEGNLVFDGNVEVGNDVMANFGIVAGGNITLRGCSDSTNLKAGGDINVGEGIIGENGVIIESGGSIKARYINQASVLCNGDCELNRGIFHSNVLCYRRILMPSGVIVGGVVYGAEGVEAREVGGVSEVKTSVLAGYNKGAPMSPDTIQLKLKNIDDEVARIGTLVKPLLQSGHEQSDEFRKYIEELQNLKKLQQELFDWSDNHDEEDCLEAVIVVRSTIHRGSSIIINNSRMDIMQTMTRVIFRYDPEKMEVVAEPLR